MSGNLITFEGPEGSGKSTHIRRLARRLDDLGIPVRQTREPGGTPTGELIRDILQHERGGEPLAARSEVLLFCASRAQLFERVIRPALEADTWVLCDRFTDSTLAYQGFGRGFDLATLETLNAFAVDHRAPDLTLLLDVSVRGGMARIRARNQAARSTADRIERETTAFHERLRRGYLHLAEVHPQRFRVIASGRPTATVADAVWAAVRDRFHLSPPDPAT